MAAISTVPLYTAQNPGWNYEALPYSIDDLPAPLPPRSEKLPWERKEALEKERQEHNVAETQKAYDEAARQKARGGFFNNMAAAVKPRWAKLKSSPRSVSEAIPSKRDERKFNDKFHFPAYERLLYSSELCKTVSGTQQILGKIYISENFVCFRESRLQPKAGRRQRLLLVIPIDEILCLSQAEITSHPDPRYAPEFSVLDQWHSKADGIFLFTRDEKVHRFFGFWTQQTYHDTYNVLDRQWRSRTITGGPLRRGESISSRNASMNELPVSRQMATSSRSPSLVGTEPISSSRSPAFVGTEPISSSRSPSFVAHEPIYSGSRSASIAGTEPLPMVMPVSGLSRSSSLGGGGGGGSSKQFQQLSKPRRLPNALNMDIKHSSAISRLRHVSAPVPRYNTVLLDSGSGRNQVELVQLDSVPSTGTGRGSQQFALAPQSRQFRTSQQYKPQQSRDREVRDWQSRQGYQGYQMEDRGGWVRRERRLPSALSQEIKRSSVRRLRHVEQPGYIPSGINFGRVVDLRTASYTKRAVPTTGYVQRERIGFQTVQQKLRSDQRGRALSPQLRDEIGHFNLRNLRHVHPVVHQWTPTAADIKMRGPSFQESGKESIQESEQKKRHRHHKHARRQGEGLAQMGASQGQGYGPIQRVEVFEYEEYDIEPSKGGKFDDQRKAQEAWQQQNLAPDRWTPSNFEAGTA